MEDPNTIKEENTQWLQIKQFLKISAVDSLDELLYPVQAFVAALFT